MVSAVGSSNSSNSSGSSASMSAGAGAEGAEINGKKDAPEVTRDVEEKREQLKDEVVEHSMSGDKTKAAEAYERYSDYVQKHYNLSPEHKQEFTDNVFRYHAAAKGWGL
ncbi:hypothetical protein HZF02_27240 [Pseudomonas yamanorum]|nr:hypothetical protein HZF02_27240 [Pseudomonas yamanorum]